MSAPGPLLLVDETPARVARLRRALATLPLTAVHDVDAAVRDAPFSVGALLVGPAASPGAALAVARRLTSSIEAAPVVFLAEGPDEVRGLQMALRFAHLGREAVVLSIDADDFADAVERVVVSAQRRKAHQGLLQTLNERLRPDAVRHADDMRAELERERRGRAEAEKMRALLERVVQQSDEMVALADADGRLLLVNDAAVALHGTDGRGVGVDGWAAAFHLLDVDGQPMAADRVPLARALRGEHVDDARWQVRRGDGALRTLAGRASPILGADGRIVGAALIARDETERLALEAQREQAVRALEETAALRERFLGIVSHDLRNPINAIAVAAAVIAEASSEALVTRTAARISASVSSMQAIIRDLLDFTRTRSGSGFPLQRVACDLAEVSRTVADELALAWPGRSLRLTTRGDARGSFDPDRCAQVVGNLVSNGFTHGAADGAVTVDVDGTGADRVVIAVHNHGPVLAGDSEALFDAFRQQSPTPASRQGLGLGLYIAREIARAHSGDLGVTSTATAGTTFRMDLPRA